MRIDVLTPQQIAPGMQATDTRTMERDIHALQRCETVEVVTSTRDVVRPGIYLADSTGGDVVVRMPPAPGFFGKITIKRTDASANSVTIEPSGAARVDGASSYPISVQNVAVQLVSDGVNWWIV